MMVALVMACMVMQSKQELEAAWDEARYHCKDMEYVRFDQSRGGKGAVGSAITIIGKDGRYLRYTRMEIPASWSDGTGRFPMIITDNTVEFYNGRKVTVYDSLKDSLMDGATPKTLEEMSLGMAIFWLDLREEKSLTLTKYVDSEYQWYTAGPGKYRLFTLSKEGDRDFLVELRLRDGFVTHGWYHSTSPRAAPMPVDTGRFYAKEPCEFDWKPPKIKKQHAVG